MLTSCCQLGESPLFRLPCPGSRREEVSPAGQAIRCAIWSAPNLPQPAHSGSARYILRQGISYRDDSPLVNGYVRGYADTYTVRSPEFFEDAYRKTPTVFELQHYGAVKRDGNWKVREGSSLARYAKGKDGPDFFRGALDLLHATYIGYHGDANEWLTDNPKLTKELLN